MSRAKEKPIDTITMLKNKDPITSACDLFTLITSATSGFPLVRAYKIRYDIVVIISVLIARPINP